MTTARPVLGWLLGLSVLCVAALVSAWIAVEAAWTREAFPQFDVGPFPRAADGARALLLVLLLALVVILGVRIRQAKAAQAAAAKLRAILESTPDPILIINGHGRIVFANAPTGRLFGYDPKALLGEPFGLLVPDRAWEKHLQLGSDRAAGAPDGPTEAVGTFAARHHHGSQFPVEVFLAPSFSAADGFSITAVIHDATRHRQTEEALREREAHLRLIVEQMPAILWTTDQELQITSSMGQGLKAVDINPNEIIGMSMLDCLDREDLEATPIAAHVAALRGASLSHDMEWKGRHFQVRVDPLREPSGRITGTIGVVLDITDHTQTVAQLRACIRQQAAVAELGRRALAGLDLPALLSEASDLVVQALDVEFGAAFELDRAGNRLLLRAGSGWEPGCVGSASAGLGDGSLAGYTLVANGPVIAEDLRAEARFRPAPFAHDHGILSGIGTAIPGKRQPFGVLCAYSKRRRQFAPEDVHFLQAVVNVLAAAIDRRQAEEAQSRLVAILEATTDFVSIAGVDQRMLYVNRAGRQMLGLGAEEDVSGLALADFCPEGVRRLVQGEALRRAARDGAWSCEATLRSRDRGDILTSQVILAHKSEGGIVEFYSTIARDISEQRRLEEQFRQAQKMEAVGRLAGGVAHDFNNLLTVITGYSEVVLDGLPADEPLRSCVEEIKKAGKRAAALTRQLLAFSRKQTLTPRVLNLNAVVTDLDKMLRRLIGEDIELVTSLDPVLLPVKADAGQVEQTLMNLAVNARDAMGGGGRLTIETRNTELGAEYVRDRPEVAPGRYALLAVRDTGCGMDPETLSHLFEPFFTTKEVGKGTGLGLATVYGIVKQSGGHVEVESAPGRGTAFKIYLPQLSERPAPSVPDPARPEAAQGTGTVLLVEDEDGVRSLACRALEGAGYTVLTARDGNEAISACRGHQGDIDLLVTDVVMPGMSGKALAQSVTGLYPGVDVLFMSGFTDSILGRKGVLPEEVDFLAKPFTPQSLLDKVQEVLCQGPRDRTTPR